MRPLGILAVVCAIATACAAQSVKVGSSAPELKPYKVLSGSAPKFGAGKVQVIHMFATWSEEFKQALPALKKLQDTHKEKADFTAVNVMEAPQEAGQSFLSEVQGWVRDRADELPPNVLVDGTSGDIHKAWMEAADQGSVPVSFIVGGDGKILWIGPSDQVGGPLSAILTGVYNPEMPTEEPEALAPGDPRLIKIDEAMYQEQNYAKAIELIDQVLQENPDLIEDLGRLKFEALMETDEMAAYKLAKSLSEDVYAEDAEQLNSLAWTMVDPDVRKQRKQLDTKLAIAIAEKANKLSEDKDPGIMDTLACAYEAAGRKKEAIALEERAIDIAKKTEDFDEDALKELENRLKSWKEGS